MALSKTQIDRLGDRLRTQDVTEADLRLLDEHRASFSASYQRVIEIIRTQLGLNPTGRQAKTTESIIAKLKRESGIRLSRMQDIAGCRIIVSNVISQDATTDWVRELFAKPRIVNRRAKPSHGYRAIHVVVNLDGRLIEIQIRTALQHLWAELSEKLSDLDPKIKYGGGPESLQESLARISKSIQDAESANPIAVSSEMISIMRESLRTLRNDQK
jgi:ppGpp synthetase/RelA/SpoT-type nucleotidyltranferase